MKYAVVTFGCRVNQADSLDIEERLCAAGAVPAPAETAEVIVVNTCSVTATADQGARQTVRRVARQNPGARIVVTGDGRVLTGLMAEENEQRIVLKTQGGKAEVIPADDVDEVAVSPLSLMPEGLEQQLQQQELLDLIAFLRLDKPPTDPAAKLIPDVTAEGK